MKHAVLGDKFVQCLFDGDQWLAMTCDEYCFDINKVIEALAFRDIEISQLDPENNYFF